MLQSDSSGFLTGEIIQDIRRVVDFLENISTGIAGIKQRLSTVLINPVSPNRVRTASPLVNQVLPVTSQGRGRGTVRPSVTERSTSIVFRSETAKPVRRQRDGRGRFLTESQRSESNRDNRGRFSSNTEESDARRERTLFNGLGDRITDAVIDVQSNLENADPTIKAFNEVAEPLKKGYQIFVGDSKDDNRWFRRIFSEIRLFRRDDTTFNRAANRSLRNLENQSETEEGGGQSFLGGLLGSVVGALAGIGPMLLTGVTTVLGTVFGPIGMAIGGAALAAWGLFSENGKKFFAGIAEDLYLGWSDLTQKIEITWDKGVKVFSDVWEPIKKWFDDKLGIVSDTLNKAGNAANEAVKKVTGVDVKQTAKSGYSEAVDFTSRKVIEPVANAMKSIPGKVSDRWNDAKQYLGDAAQKAGIDSGVLAKIANFESGFNSEARPMKKDGTRISSAHGYGQFLDDTWTETVNRHGAKYGVQNAGNLSKAEAAKLRSNKELQAGMLAEFTKENIEKGRKLGGANDDANVYALHNLGAGDGPKFLKALRQNPNAKVGDVLSRRVISGNKSLYGKGDISVSDAYQRMGKAMNRGEVFANDIRSFNSKPPIQVAQASQVTIPSAKIPSMPPVESAQDSPGVIIPMASGTDNKFVSLSITGQDVGQDLDDSRSIAHIATGGLTSRGTGNRLAQI